MPVCTGCVVIVNGQGTTPNVSSWLTGTYNQPVIGSGIGQFVNVTGFSLGNFSVYYRSATPGLCTGYSGSLAITGQSGTGLFNFNSNVYSCTGNQVCVTDIKTTFVANPLLSGIVPNYSIIGTHFDSEGNSYITKLTAASPSYEFPGGSYTGKCGFFDFMQDSFRLLVPPFSGWIGADVATTISCSPCLSGA